MPLPGPHPWLGIRTFCRAHLELGPRTVARLQVLLQPVLDRVPQLPGALPVGNAERRVEGVRRDARATPRLGPRPGELHRALSSAPGFLAAALLRGP